MISEHSSIHKPAIYYSLFLLPVITVLLLLGAVSCKDFEDCRAIYTNLAYLEIKNRTTNPVFYKVDFSVPYKHTLYDLNTKNEDDKLALKYLDKLAIPLHPKSTVVELLFYKTATDLMPDTLTIFYQVHAGMLSPACGLHQAYILDSIHTTFAEATIIKPILRTEDYEKGHEEEVKTPNVKIRY